MKAYPWAYWKSQRAMAYPWKPATAVVSPPLDSDQTKYSPPVMDLVVG
jgi:hypothetical protein